MLIFCNTPYNDKQTLAVYRVVCFFWGGNSDLCACLQGYGSDGLKLISHEESISFGESVLKLTFDPGTVEDGLLTVECRLDHPFYVKNKGMQSYKYTWVYITTFLESSCRFYYCPMLLEKSIKSNVVESIYYLYRKKKKKQQNLNKLKLQKYCKSLQARFGQVFKWSAGKQINWGEKGKLQIREAFLSN